MYKCWVEGCALPLAELRRLWWHDWACPLHEQNKRCPAYWRIIVRGIVDRLRGEHQTGLNDGN